MTDTESNYGESAINKSMTDIRNTLKKLIAVHNQAVIEDWEAMRKDADRKPHYIDEQIIVKLLALINQSNREYCNEIIGEDDEEYMYDGGIPRANNELRYQLRKEEYRMKKILYIIHWILLRIDYIIFHNTIPWDIYIDTNIEAYVLRENRKKNENKI